MNIGELLALLLRRWAVVVPMLALTAIGVAGAWTKIPTQYQSQVQLAMLNAPKVTSEPGNDGNPYLAFDTTLAVDVDFLARNVTSATSAQQLAALGMTDAYTAAIANNALGPFMQLTATGRNRADVSQSIQVLINFTEQRWQDLQKASSAPTDSLIGMTEIAPPSAPTPVRKRKFEAVAGVAIAGLILSVVAGVLADSFRRRRRLRYQVHETARVNEPARASQTAPPSEPVRASQTAPPSEPARASQTAPPSEAARASQPARLNEPARVNEPARISQTAPPSEPARASQPARVSEPADTRQVPRHVPIR
jgi:hypothetical protein